MIPEYVRYRESTDHECEFTSCPVTECDGEMEASTSGIIHKETEWVCQECGAKYTESDGPVIQGVPDATKVGYVKGTSEYEDETLVRKKLYNSLNESYTMI